MQDAIIVQSVVINVLTCLKGPFQSLSLIGQFRFQMLSILPNINRESPNENILHYDEEDTELQLTKSKRRVTSVKPSGDVPSNV